MGRAPKSIRSEVAIVPLYEYRCEACGYSFEKIQSFSAEPERVCPKCNGQLIRPMSVPALQFKGSGWYINDYSSKGSSSAAAPAAAGEGSAAAPADTSAPAASTPPTTPSPTPSA